VLAHPWLTQLDTFEQQDHELGCLKQGGQLLLWQTCSVRGLAGPPQETGG
jgi:hypothetical protein